MNGSDLQVTIKGVEEKLANKIGNAILAIVNSLDEYLDFRRMHRIVITTDFAGELIELSDKTAFKSPITYTNEKYGIAIGKVLTLPKEDDFEILPVFNAYQAVTLLKDDLENIDEIQFRRTIHLLHHELCHVHEDNKKIDALKPIILNYCYNGKDKFIWPLAEMSWSEYFANRLSSATADECFILAIIESFKDAIERTKRDFDSEIGSYRLHANLDNLLELFQRHGHFLIQVASYTLGYLDGLEKSLSDFSSEAVEMLSGSYFEPTWNGMQKTLRDMFLMYADWKDLNFYKDLANVLERYYSDMGLVLSTTENGEIYVHVPFRPGTI